MDILLAFPAVVLLLAIITVIGDEDSAVRKFLSNNTPLPDRDFIGIPNFLDVFIVALAIGLAVAVFTTRVVRGAVLSIKENVYVDAARAMGASDAAHHVAAHLPERDCARGHPRQRAAAGGDPGRGDDQLPWHRRADPDAFLGRGPERREEPAV